MCLVSEDRQGVMSCQWGETGCVSCQWGQTGCDALSVETDRV